MADLKEIAKILEDIRDDTVPGLTTAIEDLTKATGGSVTATKKAAEAARKAAKATEDFDEASKKAKKSSKELTMGLDLMKKGFDSVSTGVGRLSRGIGGMVGTAFDATKALKAKSDIVVGLTQEMRRSTGMSREMALGIGRTSDALRIYGVSADEAAGAIESLYTETTVFSQMSTELQDKLAQEAALMAELGVSNSDYAKALEVSMKTMGMSGDQAADNIRQLRAMAIDLDIPISQLTKNFGENANMLAKLGDNGVAAFGELSRISKVTGLEMNKLLGVVDKFDTFEGAADAAGSLNAALGGNFVDSMSLMMETDPAERFKMIRNAVDDAGVAFEDMGYFQKKMMADAAGFSDVGDFAKAMSGDLSALASNMGETDSTVEAAMEEAAIVRTPEEMAANFAKALEPAAGAIAETMIDASEQFATKMLPTIQALDASTRGMTDDLIAADEDNIIGKVLSAIDVFNEFKDKIMMVVGFLKGLGLTIAGPFTIVKGILLSIGGVLTSFPVVVIGVVTAITGAIMGVKLKLNEIKALFSAGKFFEGLSLGAAAAITGVIATFGKLAAYLAEALGFNAPWITTFKDAFSPETFDKIMLGIGNTIMAGFDNLVMPIVNFWKDLDLKTPAMNAAISVYDGFMDFFQISSPSKLMMNMIGGPLMDGILAPFTDIGTKLKDLMMGALEMIPAPIKDLMLGKSVFETAGDLAGMAADKAAGVFDAVSDVVGGDDTKEPQVITISLNMDGREFDRKVINIVGGIARDATGV